MIFGRHYQNGYVTSDVDRAVDVLQREHGLTGEVQRMSASQAVWTAEGEGTQHLELAFLWAGNLQIELIQPVDGLIGLYREALRPNVLFQFHHVAMRADDWDGLLAEIERRNAKLALKGEVGAFKFLYLDARETLGHYLEYVSGPPEYWASHPT